MCSASSLHSLCMVCMGCVDMPISLMPCTHRPPHTSICTTTICTHPPHHSFMSCVPGGGMVGPVPMVGCPMALVPTLHTHVLNIHSIPYPDTNFATPTSVLIPMQPQGSHTPHMHIHCHACCPGVTMCSASSLHSLYMVCMGCVDMSISLMPCTHRPPRTSIRTSTICTHPPHHSSMLCMPGGGMVGPVPMVGCPMAVVPTHHTAASNIRSATYP